MTHTESFAEVDGNSQVETAARKLSEMVALSTVTTAMNVVPLT